MDEYISREAMLSKCQQIWNDADETTEIGVAIINIVDDLANFVENIPSADVQSVKHGQWIIDYVEGTKIYHAHCSECNKEPDRNIGGDYYIDKLSDFCPNCGARMDLKENKDGDNDGKD